MRFYMHYHRVSLARVLFLFFFLVAVSLTVVGDDLFTAECLAGEYLSRFFESFPNIPLLESRIPSVIRYRRKRARARALRAHEVGVEGLDNLIERGELKNGELISEKLSDSN